jgi:hypothetical protein
MAESGPGSIRDGMRWGLLPAAVSGYRLPRVAHNFQSSRADETGRSDGNGSLPDELHGCGYRHRNRFGCGLWALLYPAAANDQADMMYQLGWSTLPGLRGLSCSDFRATPTADPDTERGVAVEFASETERDNFLRQLEEHFAGRRFTNAADAFDTVKAYVLGQTTRKKFL